MNQNRLSEKNCNSKPIFALFTDFLCRSLAFVSSSDHCKTQNWKKSCILLIRIDKMGKKCEKVGSKIGKIWQKLTKIGQKLAKIGKNW